MTEFELASLPADYSLKTSMNFKMGRYTIFANISVVVAFIAGIISVFFIFEIDASKLSLFEGGLVSEFWIVAGIIFGFLLLNILAQLFVYKAGGAGNTKLHLGMMIDINTENAISRSNYTLALLVSNLVPLFIAIVLAIFFWSPGTYLGLFVIVANVMVVIPALVFVLKQDRKSLVHFNKGSLRIYSKTEASA